MPLGIGIYGAAGRMGQTLLRLIFQADDLHLAAAYEADGHPLLGKDAGSLCGLEECGVLLQALPEKIDVDVLIDFSLPQGTATLLDKLQTQPLPYICGTTGLDEAMQARLHDLAKLTAVVWAPNFSTGVSLLFDLVSKAASILGVESDIEITEIHHRHKKDAPSGTAAKLAELAALGRGSDPKQDLLYGRKGISGERERATIGVHALRGGEVVGEHTVHFLADGERLELTHRAGSREAFAGGALKAARWAVTKEAGMYDMMNVLGLGK